MKLFAKRCNFGALFVILFLVALTGALWGLTYAAAGPAGTHWTGAVITWVVITLAVGGVPAVLLVWPNLWEPGEGEHRGALAEPDWGALIRRAPER